MFSIKDFTFELTLFDIFILMTGVHLFQRFEMLPQKRKQNKI